MFQTILIRIRRFGFSLVSVLVWLRFVSNFGFRISDLFLWLLTERRKFLQRRQQFTVTMNQSLWLGSHERLLIVIGMLGG